MENSTDDIRLFTGDTVLAFNKTQDGKMKPVESAQIRHITDTEVTVVISATYGASDGRLTSKPPEFIGVRAFDGKLYHDLDS